MNGKTTLWQIIHTTSRSSYQTFILSDGTFGAPQCLRTADDITSNQETVIEVAAQHCAGSVCDHAEVTEEVLVVVFGIPPYQLRRTPATRPQIQPARCPGRAGEVARLLDEFSCRTRYAAWIPCPDIARQVFAPPTVSVRAVAVLVERRHRACDIVPDAREMTFLIVAEHLRVAAARRACKRSVGVPGVDLRQPRRAVDDLCQASCSIVGVGSIMGRHAVRYNKRRFAPVRLVVGVRPAVGLRTGSGFAEQVVGVVVTEARHIAARQFRDARDAVAVVIDRRVGDQHRVRCHYAMYDSTDPVAAIVAVFDTHAVGIGQRAELPVDRVDQIGISSASPLPSEE